MDMGSSVSQNHARNIWLESEEYGLFRPDLLNAFMKVNKQLSEKTKLVGDK